MQISFAVTAKLISAFVFATRIVQSLYFLNFKPLAILCGCTAWFVSDLVEKSRRPVFSRGSFRPPGTQFLYSKTGAAFTGLNVVFFFILLKTKISGYSKEPSGFYRILTIFFFEQKQRNHHNFSSQNCHFYSCKQYEPRSEKTVLQGFRPGPTQTGGCAATEDGKRLGISDLESRGIVLSV